MTGVSSPPWVYSDGGRAAAGFSGNVDDCSVRSIAIALALPYERVHRELSRDLGASADYGMSQQAIHKYVFSYGWRWTQTTGMVSNSFYVHLREGQLPPGRIIARIPNHVTAVIDGVIHDTFDPSEGGHRGVIGYWSKK